MCDLEKEYSPSVWNKRFNTGKEVLDFHMKFVEEKTKEPRIQFKCDLNISYGNGVNEKFDIFHNDLPDGIYKFLHFL